MSSRPTSGRSGSARYAVALLVAGLLTTDLLVGVRPAAAQDVAPVDTGARPSPTEPVEGVDYRIYDRHGAPSTLFDVVHGAMNDDVLLVGEEHDDMVGHAVEARLLETVLLEVGAVRAPARTVVLSLEMFERDVQYVLDEYLAGLIGEEPFLRSARPWDDYDARYRPLVELAKSAGVPVVAANAPRRYVSRVTSEGPRSLEDLSAEALRFLPPLPYPGPSTAYREQWDSVMDAAMEAHRDEEGREYSLSPNAIWSQSLWDASMGHAITQALVRHVKGFVVHVAGSFHVAEGTGIPERIADYRPGTRVTTVVLTKVDDVGAWSAEEHGSLADFVVLTKEPER